MRRYGWILLFLTVWSLQAQKEFSGGYYSVWQYYTADSITGFTPPEGNWRGMQYFNVRYAKKHWEFGVQLESYLPQSLLGYDPALQGTVVSNYYARYRQKEWDVTAGYIFDQFGSGLVFRTWEDRTLGINNALTGLRVGYRKNGISATVLGGNPRTGREVSPSAVVGADLQWEWERVIGLGEGWQSGFSVVSKYETPQTEKLPATVNLYSFRTSYRKGAFDFLFEYAYKTPDGLYGNGVVDDLVLFDGDAYLFSAGYAQKGFGTNLTLRRTENMRLYASRELTGNPYNTGLLNYIPALTAQHDYLLTNLFVYAARDQISFADQTVGEIGGEWDTYIFLKRKSRLGGKYGTRLAFHWSRWHGLKAEFMPALHTYRAEMWEPGELYYQDIHVQIKRKLSRRLKAGLLLMKQDYNRTVLEGHGEMLHNLIAVTDWQWKLRRRSAVRVAAEHLWNREDEGNWLAGTVEWTRKGKWNFHLADRYHYGGSGIHYYTAGIGYMKDGNRIDLAYGRERGGMVCVGGICRYVPPSSGWQVRINIRF